MSKTDTPTNPVSSVEYTETKWIYIESSRTLMSKVAKTQLVMYVFMCLMVALLLNEASHSLLLAWFLLNSALSAYRAFLLNQFSQADMVHKDKYYRQYLRIAPLSGYLWGGALYLFNGVVQPNIAIFCLIVVATFGLFSVSNLSSNIKHFKVFLVAYTFGLLVAVSLHIYTEHGVSPSTPQGWYRRDIDISWPWLCTS